MRIKKGDIVLIVKGKDRGKKGKVLRTFPKKMKILVEGVNLIKKHQRPKKEGEKGQITQISVPIFVSKAKLICPKCSKPIKVGYRIEGEKKYRFCRKCKNIID